MPGNVRRIQSSSPTPLEPSLRGRASPSKTTNQGRSARTGPERSIMSSKLSPQLRVPKPMDRGQVRAALDRVKREARRAPERTLQAASGLITRPSNTIREAARAAERDSS